MGGARGYATFFIIFAAYILAMCVLFGFPLSVWLKAASIVLVGCAVLGFMEEREQCRSKRVPIDRPSVAQTPDHHWNLPAQTWAFIHAMRMLSSSGCIDHPERFQQGAVELSAHWRSVGQAALSEARKRRPCSRANLTR